MEKTYKPRFENFEEDGVLKFVSDTTMSIALTLSKMGISSEVRKHNSSLVIMLKGDDEIFDDRARTVTEDYEKPGIKITFNVAEQIIRVSPTKN